MYQTDMIHLRGICITIEDKKKWVFIQEDLLTESASGPVMSLSRKRGREEYQERNWIPGAGAMSREDGARVVTEIVIRTGIVFN
ncbi:hypothetical protein EVAR_100667_1 [Eumeta japonica]|uniref:Uncharacterized protein n=1 Tax=Eumeta variegata TaxID=151549 RepID=A0A4C1SE00_EUMVA|nr:hypothetical protein EVAR_100667_1 [Eumeta japonica]